ncbi:MAG: Adenosine monophosphate-protein transferase SoFic [Chlamydiae bacterium]|nr:Adenosine monophosphate-protein transferase SoFic [Chlamydiota bacterium]
MKWNWQLPNWPKFIYDPHLIVDLEKRFLQEIGGAAAVLKHLESEKRRQFFVEILCEEGLNSAEIEGEILERESLQSSIQRYFGLGTKSARIPAREKQVGDLLWMVYDTYAEPLTHEMLYSWHQVLMSGVSTISDIGKYRTHQAPMQIVSNKYHQQTVFFEAPPSKNLGVEMEKFIQWFNDSDNNGSILGKAAIVHIYFESIHPFEDGNGRIGRALVEKFLSQSLKRPTLIAISQTLNEKKKEYYSYLADCNHKLKVDNFVKYFSNVIVRAQKNSLRFIHFLMSKTHIMERLKGNINSRQENVLLRMFAEGVRGFKGGLSAENYIAITKTSKATATRDLTDLVEKGVLRKTGRLRHTRYWLNIET